MAALPVLWHTRKLSEATVARATRDYDTIVNHKDRLHSADEIIAMSARVDAILPCHSEIFNADVAGRLNPRVKIIGKKKRFCKILPVRLKTGVVDLRARPM